MKELDNKPYVLIVDDNPKNLQVLGNLLTNDGFRVAAAQNGEQALQYVKQRSPDIILLDIMMPDMNGFEVCKAIKSNPKANDIPILFITALTDVTDKTKAFEAGGADYITKPFLQEEVLARVKVHLENARLLKDLKTTNLELKNTNDLKDKFLGMAAHDIRSPLGGMNGIVEVILNEELGEINANQKQLLALVLKTGHQIMNLVADLLDISVIETGNLTLNLEETNLTDLVEERVTLHQITTRKKEISVKANLEKGPKIQLDKDRFNQVLDNLLTNAVKYSPSATTIKVNLKYNNHCAIVEVCDEGPGISEKDQEKLFRLFQKLSTKPTKGEKSSGLGLAITKKIVDLHRGEISVQSALGRGSCFSVSLPI